MTQLFTPLVNSLVGQATPVATATLIATGPAVDAVEVIMIDPPERFVKKVEYLSLIQHLSRLGTKQFSGSTDPCWGQNRSRRNQYLKVRKNQNEHFYKKVILVKISLRRALR